MGIMYLTWLGILGLIVGSFLNVVIVRFNTGLSFVSGRSVCFSCGKKLGFFELIPLVSFLVQKGKCRGCYSRLSCQYPIVEGLTASIFIFLFFKIRPDDVLSSILFFLSCIIFSLLIVISVYDMKHKSIPNIFSYSFSGLALVLAFLKAYPAFPSLSLLSIGPLLGLFFFLLWFITRGRGVGLGDAKLALGIGWFLGFSSGVAALLLSFWIGALYALSIIGWQKYKNIHGLSLKSEIPFGPFLVIALAISFFGDITLETIAAFLSFGV